jgi:CBS domain containing-hemolysin-like protein
MLGLMRPLATSTGWALDLLLFLAIPALVLLNGFFVAAEFALVAVRKTQVEEMLRHGKSGAEALDNATRHLDRSIAASQLGITIASLVLGWVSEPALAGLLEPLLSFLPANWLGPAIHATAITVLALCIGTFLHVVVGEQVPKVMALQKPVPIALWVAVPLEIFTRATRPVVVMMNAVGNWIVRRLGFHAVTGEQMVHSVEELTMLVEEVEEAGLLSADQAAYVQNVFRLAQKRVSDCMVPRDKMAALELHLPPDKILEAVREGAHTRMPVYDGQFDNIVGIVNTKNLFFLFSLRGVVVLEDAMYPALFLKPEQLIADALRLFRRARRPMAIVRNEEGKLLGLVTLEDILEEIVGDIEDEHDYPARTVRPSTSAAGSATVRRPPNQQEKGASR